MTSEKAAYLGLQLSGGDRKATFFHLCQRLGIVWQTKTWLLTAGWLPIAPAASEPI